MPIILTTPPFAEELTRTRKQVLRYVSQRLEKRSNLSMWGPLSLFWSERKPRPSDANWLTDWLRLNRGWLKGSQLHRGIRPPSAALESEEQYNAYYKATLTTLLSNYQQGAWYQRFVWWFRFPQTKLICLQAGYELLEHLPKNREDVKPLSGIRHVLSTVLTRISARSGLHGIVSQGKERIDYKEKYAFSSQLIQALSVYLEEVQAYGKKSKSFFSWQSHSAFAEELGLDNAAYRAMRKGTLRRLSRINADQEKELDLIYYVELKDALLNSQGVLSHPLAVKGQQEERWHQEIRRLLGMLKEGLKELPGGSTMLNIYRRLASELQRFRTYAGPEIQEADYKTVLESSFVEVQRAGIAAPVVKEAEVPKSKMLRLTKASLQICLRLEVEGIDSRSEEVSWDAVRARYKALCLRLHPDRYPDESSKQKATESFKALQVDYQSLLHALEEGDDAISDPDFERELSEEEDRMNEFFAECEVKLKALDEKIKVHREGTAHLMREFAETRRECEALERGVEAYAQSVDANRTLVDEYRKTVDEHRKTVDEHRKTVDEHRKTVDEHLKINQDIARMSKEQDEQLRQARVEIMQAFAVRFRGEQQKYPEYVLIHFSPKRYEACVKFGVPGAAEAGHNQLIIRLDAYLNDSRETYLTIFKELTLKHKTRETLQSDFANLQSKYAEVLTALDETDEYELESKIHEAVKTERAHMKEVAAEFESILKKQETVATEPVMPTVRM